jgi:hypothetical protein
MKVQFVQSGGFAGAVQGCELDTAALEPEVAQELERLIRGSGISGSGEFLSNTGRDLRQYDITIEEGHRKASVVFDDATIPPAAKPLLGFLKKQARPTTSR